MKIIILNGPAEVGKGTFLKFLEEIFKLSIYKRSSIFWAKQVLTAHFNWNGKKDPKSRKILGAIKALGIEYGDIPFNDTLYHALEAKENLFDIFATDIREPDEIKKVVDHFTKLGVSVWTIRISNREKEMEASINLAKTDNLYMGYLYDFVIRNDGTIEEFKETISILFRNYFK